MLCLDPPHIWKIYNIPMLHLEFSFHNYQQQLFHKHHLSTMTYQLCYPPNLLPFLSCFSEFHFPMLICLHCSLFSLISSVAFAGKDALSHFIQSNPLIQTEFLPNTSKSETSIANISNNVLTSHKHPIFWLGKSVYFHYPVSHPLLQWFLLIIY